VKVKTCQLPPAKVSQKFMSETIKAAEIEQENLSEYIRRAVELRNEDVLRGIIPKPHWLKEEFFKNVDKTYLAELKKMPETERKALLYGEWGYDIPKKDEGKD
jgi:hypothetical protein